LIRHAGNFTELSKCGAYQADMWVYPKPLEGELKIEFNVFADKSEVTLSILDHRTGY
jgi:hypothetical protein